METWAVRHVVGLNWVVIVVASGAEEGAAVDAESGDGVVKDSENGVSLVVAGGESGARRVEVARELRPVCAADGAGDTAVAHVGGDASEVEGVGALRCEYGLAWATASLAVVT